MTLRSRITARGLRISLFKRLVFGVLAAIIALAVLEGGLGVLWLARDLWQFRNSLPVARIFKEHYHTRHDGEMGWENIPGKQLAGFYGDGRDLTINNEGYRGRENYYGNKPRDRIRVVCLGDSFTFGYGVDDMDTYPAQLQRLNPGIQTVNMGLGGYSIGQFLLWYQREAERLEADSLVCAFILDDIWRLSETRLVSGVAMPVFSVQDGQLHVSGQPVPPPVAAGRRILPRGELMRFLINNSGLFRSLDALTGILRASIISRQHDDLTVIALAVLDELHRITRQTDVSLHLVLLPELRDLVDPDQAREFQRMAARLEKFAAARQIPFLNLYPAFARQGAADIDRLFLSESWYHYSAAGNRLVAEHINAFLD